MGGYLWFSIGFVLGILVSGMFFFLAVDQYYVGNLREDRSIPDEPYYFMEIAKGRFERLRKNKFAVMRVVRENYIQEKEE